jgi:hypothetical protein
LANALLNAGHEVHIITGIFDEAGDWQSETAKITKLHHIGVPFITVTSLSQGFPLANRTATLHMLHAVGPEFPIDYRLRDLGLRKGDLSQKLGLEVFLDDSKTYVEMMPAMDGNVTILQVH